MDLWIWHLVCSIRSGVVSVYVRFTLRVMGPQEQDNKKPLIVGGCRYETDDTAVLASSSAADGGVRK
jgi:hypothetical protein